MAEMAKNGGGMTKYVLKRILLMIFTMFVIMTICFMLIRILPVNCLRRNPPAADRSPLGRTGYNNAFADPVRDLSEEYLYQVGFWYLLVHLSPAGLPGKC